MMDCFESHLKKKLHRQQQSHQHVALNDHTILSISCRKQTQRIRSVHTPRTLPLPTETG